MKQTSKWATKADFNVLKVIGCIAEAAKKSNLQKTKLKKVQNELQLLSSYLNCTSNQALLFCVIFSLNINTKGVNLKEIADFFNCNSLKILEYKKDLDRMCEMHLLEIVVDAEDFSTHISQVKYNLTSNTTDAVLANKKPEKIVTNTEFSIYEALDTISKRIENKGERIFATEDLHKWILQYIKRHSDIPFFKSILVFNKYELLVCLHIAHQALNGEDEHYAQPIVDKLFVKTADKVKCRSSLAKNEGKLFENRLLETHSDSYFTNDLQIKATKKLYEMMIGEDAIAFTFNKKDDDKNLIKADKIAKKTMFFNDSEKRQIKFLFDTIEDTNLKMLQTRLKKKHLPTGITMIFFGPPGTGKTETAYQLARQTSRSVMHVDISNTKSMWFGESEKKIKRIFTDYKELCKNQPIMPILLFNEADAIFSKRKEVFRSNVAQTENAIQNIILEEMEKFEGILIATTNLEINLDTAFERRFLHKISFGKPNKDVKSKIWKSKLRLLTKEDCDMLASRFDYSGGQIDNIVRKTLMNEVLNNAKPDLDLIINFCEEESLKKEMRKIGFLKV